MGADENMKVVVSYDDLKNHLLASEKDKSKVMVYEKFFNEVLPNTTDIGISKVDLLIKYRFSEIGVRCEQLLFAKISDHYLIFV